MASLCSVPNLRQNLLRGGATEDTLAVLTGVESKWQEDGGQQTLSPISYDNQGRSGDFTHHTCQTTPAATKFCSKLHRAVFPAQQQACET
nr:uncharacterized protein CTRU02_12527 [Colletotrichum truncatum]KAF6784538.1 hypothetical protein CTRU02_12527 [Colletotrichum truncatum]